MEIPERYRNAKLSDLQGNTGNNLFLQEVKKQIEQFAAKQRPEKGIFVYGSPGNGKTHAIMTLARSIEWINKENARANDMHSFTPDLFTMSVVKFRDLLRSVAQSWKEGGSPVQEAAGADVVIVDDLTVRAERGNANSPYQWAYEATNELIDTVWDRCGLLYVTSNNSRIELAAAFGDPFFDRIAGLCEVIENKDKSHRC